MKTIKLPARGPGGKFLPYSVAKGKIVPQTAGRRGPGRPRKHPVAGAMPPPIARIAPTNGEAADMNSDLPRAAVPLGAAPTPPPPAPHVPSPSNLGYAMPSMRNDLPFIGTEAIEPSAEDKMRAMVMAVTGTSDKEGAVKIWKENDDSRNMEYVCSRTASEFLADGADFIARQFGAGAYECRIYRPDGEVYQRPRILISREAEAFAKTHGKGKRGAEPEQQPIVEAVLAGFAKLQQEIANSRGPGADRRAMLDELIIMKQLFAGGGNALDPLDMFAKMAGLFRDLQPREPSDNVFVEMLDRFSPVIMDAMKNAQPAALAAPATLQPRPAAGAINAQPAAPGKTPEQEGAEQMSLRLKMQLGYLCGKAAADSDPEPYAAIIVEEVPREAIEKLAHSDNWLDELAKFNPNVKKFPEWFAELRECVLEELKPVDERDNIENLQDNSDDVIEPAGIELPGSDDVPDESEN